MPHIAIKGLDENSVANVSKTLPAALVPIVGGSPSSVLIQHIPAKFYVDGVESVTPPVIVQVDTQPRPQEVLDAFAETLASVLRPYTKQDIEIYFICNSIDLYYHNGKHIS